jgi:hypothetical protein
MYQKINSISVPSLWKFKAIPFFNINHLTFLEDLACARLDFATWKTIAPKGVRYKHIDNCLSQLEIRMAEKITLFKLLKYMVKHMELNPEWILNELPQSHYANGGGVVSLDTDSATDAKWITLALNTLSIPYEENEYGDGDMTFIDIEFNLEDLRTDCPTLYKKMKEMDTKNKIYKNTSVN